MTAISFIVGLSISAQTFYTFVLENLDRVWRAEGNGAKGRELVYMLLFQAGITCLAGYGLGIGLCTVLIAAAKLRVPDYASVITFETSAWPSSWSSSSPRSPATSRFAACSRLEPFDIFRS